MKVVFEGCTFSGQVTINDNQEDHSKKCEGNKPSLGDMMNISSIIDKIVGDKPEASDTPEVEA